MGLMGPWASQIGCGVERLFPPNGEDCARVRAVAESLRNPDPQSGSSQHLRHWSVAASAPSQSAPIVEKRHSARPPAVGRVSVVRNGPMGTVMNHCPSLWPGAETAPSRAMGASARLGQVAPGGRMSDCERYPLTSRHGSRQTFPLAPGAASEFRVRVVAALCDVRSRTAALRANRTRRSQGRSRTTPLGSEVELAVDPQASL